MPLKKDEILTVGEYTITRFNEDDYWIENETGEGMQIFAYNFEQFIDSFFKSEI